MPDPVQDQTSADTKSGPRTASSVHDINAVKPPFGARWVSSLAHNIKRITRAWEDRFLTDEANVWSQNAWDHVPPPDDQVETIAAALARQSVAPVPDEDKFKYNNKPSRHW